MEMMRIGTCACRRLNCNSSCFMFISVMRGIGIIITIISLIKTELVVKATFASLQTSGNCSYGSMKCLLSSSMYDEQNQNMKEGVAENMAFGCSSSTLDRREYLRTSCKHAMITSVVSSVPMSASATVGKVDFEQVSYDVDSLNDLPELAPNHVRLFLVRHGQTENNRLRLVQGARVDPPINLTGQLMARRDGMVLSELCSRGKTCPKMIVHSQLMRAKETAEEIASVVANTKGKNLLIQQFDGLGEVDFGPVAEGQPISEVRAEMTKIYGYWALGQIDKEPDAGGETGRAVISRACESLLYLTKMAQRSGGSIVAVSHSTFLRILLGVCLDKPLLEAATIEQKNGCINVIDVDPGGPLIKISQNSNIFGGSLSLAPQGTEFFRPSLKVIRVNEYRQLKGLI